MKRKRVGIIVICFAVIALMACVTVNIVFPPEAQKAMDTIVEDVYKKGEEPKKEKESLLESRRFIAAFLSLLTVRPAHAQLNWNISTPAIRALRKSLEKRHKSLAPYYNAGNIGIKNDGYIDIRSAKGLGLKQRATLKRLVDAENADRRSLYKEILKANGLGRGAMGQLQKMAANSWRGKAKKGWWVQKDDGTWVKK